MEISKVCEHDATLCALANLVDLQLVALYGVARALVY